MNKQSCAALQTITLKKKKQKSRPPVVNFWTAEKLRLRNNIFYKFENSDCERAFFKLWKWTCGQLTKWCKPTYENQNGNAYLIEISKQNTSVL